MAMLEVNNLSIQFGGLHAVDNFQLKIEKGELYGLIGPNGAGKQPYLIFLQVFISQQRELSSWMGWISPEKVLSILIKLESHEHSRIFDFLKI